VITLPTWTKEQSDAIYKSGKNIIVSAGAGSGKTAVLTTRVLHKLENGIHVNELLILTFTKAAASEMKERIRKNLRKKPDLKPELLLLDTAYVTTFDSFSLSIVKKYHYLLNVSSNLKITDNTMIEMLRKDVLRKTMDKFYTNKDVNFLKLIDEFCVKDDHEIYDAMLNISKSFEKDFTKLERLDGYQQLYFSEQKIEEYLNEFEQLVIKKQSDLKEKINEFERIASKDYISKIYENLNGLLSFSTIDDLVSVKSSKIPPLPKNSEEEIKEEKEQLNNVLKDLKKLLDYGTKEQLKNDLLQLKEFVNVFVLVLKDYLKELENQKKEKNYYDFNDIAFLALNLLKNNQEVCDEIKNSFKEIMIDEYQDTNDIQEEFIRLISQNNVYMVGDIKQSIYRFRNANPYLFKKKYDNYRQKINGEKIDLLKNFRSRKEVLQNINLIFNNIMIDNFGGANYLEEHQMVFGNQDYLEKGLTSENYNMEILTYENPKNTGFTKEELEVFAIGKDIQKKINEGYLLYNKDENQVHPAKYQDFVILMDRSSSFDLYKKIFNYLKIPISIEKDETLNDSTCFLVIKNLLKVLLSYTEKNFDTNFRFSFVSVLRSFLFNYQDQAIYDLLQSSSWYQNQLYETIRPILNNISTKSITKILHEVYECTELYRKMIQIGDIKENMMILSSIQNLAENYQLEGKNLKSFYEFLSRINKEEMNITYTNETTSNECVKIMTIHKSKGLEYPICYFSGLYKNFNISDVKEKFIYDKKYGIITPLKEEGMYSCFLKELIKENYLIEEISEKIRLFYVAVTRAKEKMIFLVPKKEKEFPNGIQNQQIKCRSLADFLYMIWDYLKSYQIPVNQNEISLTKNYLNTELEKNWQKNSKLKLQIQELEYQKEEKSQIKYSKNMISLNNLEDDKNIKLGLKIHEYLELIDFHNPDYSVISEKIIQNKIKKFLNSSFLQKRLNGEIYKEYEFVFENENKEHHGIIDLMIIEDNLITIVDYKLNHLFDEAYIKQLNGYQEYIKEQSGKPVELYLYSILKEDFLAIKNNQVML